MGFRRDQILLCCVVGLDTVLRQTKHPILQAMNMRLIKEAGLENLNSIIGCKLESTAEILNRNLEAALKTSQKHFEIRKATLESIKDLGTHRSLEWSSRFDKIAETEADLKSFLNPESEDLKALQTDALSQLSFQMEELRCLNDIPFLLSVVAIFKIWVVPALAVLTPLVMWILPYIFIRFIYNLPITQEQYNEILGVFLSGNPIDLNRFRGGAPVPQPAMNSRSLIQYIFMAFSFAQSLIQPVQNAMHLNTIDSKLIENGQKLLKLKGHYNFFLAEFERLGIQHTFRRPLEILEDDPRRAVYFLIEQPERIRIALRDLAELEILWRLVNSAFLRPAEIITKGEHPLFVGKNMIDISLGKSAVPSSITLDGKQHHAALTGPNGGGKSSFMRSIIQSTLLSHAYGLAPAEKLVVRRFSWISSGLRIQDRPGDLSFFEAEVFFASGILKREDGIGLVLYDELFHSTNPPDGIRTAELFLKSLWNKPSVVSIVSTHVFDLVDSAPEVVKKICCNAVEVGDRIAFSYEVVPGVSKMSSVTEIWNRFGLGAVA